MSLRGRRTSVFTFQSAVHSSHVLARLNDQRLSDVLCDITLVVGGRTFRAHCSVLASCSDYFHSRIIKNTRPSMVLYMPDQVTVEGFEPLLQFAYTSQLLFTKDNLLDIHKGIMGASVCPMATNKGEGSVNECTLSCEMTSVDDISVSVLSEAEDAEVDSDELDSDELDSDELDSDEPVVAEFNTGSPRGSQLGENAGLQNAVFHMLAAGGGLEGREVKNTDGCPMFLLEPRGSSQEPILEQREQPAGGAHFPDSTFSDSALSDPSRSDPSHSDPSLSDPSLCGLKSEEGGFGLVERTSVEREVAEHLAKGFWPDLKPSQTDHPSSVSNLDPMENEGSHLDPMENRGPYLDPTENRDPYLDPMENRDPYLDPTENRDPYLDPMENRGPMDNRGSHLDPLEDRGLRRVPHLVPMSNRSLRRLPSLNTEEHSGLGKDADFHWQLDLTSNPGDCPFLRELGTEEVGSLAEIGEDGGVVVMGEGREMEEVGEDGGVVEMGEGREMEEMGEDGGVVEMGEGREMGEDGGVVEMGEGREMKEVGGAVKVDELNQTVVGRTPEGDNSLSQSEKSPYMSSVNSGEDSDLDTDGDTEREANNKRAQEVCLPFPVDQILSVSRSAFQQLIRRQHLTPEQSEFVHDVRRRSKNRVAAQRCRKRKLEGINKLEYEISTLSREKKRLMEERDLLKRNMEDTVECLTGQEHSQMETASENTSIVTAAHPP
ncbi:hypothetical protein DPEC_G00296520 [Dallia pectoralis]|uniref:Uncharacterized protein n=1 Tax=Dallia pectoralis TaxID=75939 RepID=A0ACC2FFF3_DALPE|nr:hypothetical protein DPEC_G00296520 [Dallia pectoralis]